MVLSWISKILLDSSNQYDHFEVQHAYFVMKIKEVMAISTWTRPKVFQIFLRGENYSESVQMTKYERILNHLSICLI